MMKSEQKRKLHKAIPRKCRDTGPKTSEGKRVSSLNALRHGLNLPIDKDLAYGGKVGRLAQFLAGPDAGQTELAWAHRSALAHMEVLRAREAIRQVFERPMRSKRRTKQSVVFAKLRRQYYAEQDASISVEHEESLTDIVYGVSSVDPIDHLRDRLMEIEKMDRYQMRAISRRKFALRELGQMSRVVKPK
jgi:hypothetical protein